MWAGIGGRELLFWLQVGFKDAEVVAEQSFPVLVDTSRNGEGFDPAPDP
jgi:hypothetical protein